jgi:phospholipid N-methyltransferase
MSVLEILVISFAVIQVSLLVRSIFTQKQKISELRAQLNSIHLNLVPSNKVVELNYAGLSRARLNKEGYFTKGSKNINRSFPSASRRNNYKVNIHNAA